MVVVICWWWWVVVVVSGTAQHSLRAPPVRAPTSAVKSRTAPHAHPPSLSFSLSLSCLFLFLFLCPLLQRAEEAAAPDDDDGDADGDQLRGAAHADVRLEQAPPHILQEIVSPPPSPSPATPNSNPSAPRFTFHLTFEAAQSHDPTFEAAQSHALISFCAVCCVPPALPLQFRPVHPAALDAQAGCEHVGEFFSPFFSGLPQFARPS